MVLGLGKALNFVTRRNRGENQASADVVAKHTVVKLRPAEGAQLIQQCCRMLRSSMLWSRFGCR